VFFLLGVAGVAADEKNKLPNEARAILERAEQFELLSLEPKKDDKAPKDAFHGWKVLGRTAVKDAESRKKLVAALLKGVEDASEKDAARCFIPRHGIRATHAGKTADFVICFECSYVEVLVGGKKLEGAFVKPSPQPTFDKVLRDAKIPLSKKPTVKRKKIKLGRGGDRKSKDYLLATHGGKREGTRYTGPPGAFWSASAG
jgi:hypothetical protein